MIVYEVSPTVPAKLFATKEEANAYAAEENRYMEERFGMPADDPMYVIHRHELETG